MSTNPLTPIYINRINNRLVFKLNDRYNLELQTPETMKIFGSTKKIRDKTNNRENVPTLVVVEVVLVQYNILDNQSLKRSEVLYTFILSKSYAYLLNVEPRNLVFLKICNTEFDDIVITFTDQNGRSLEIEEKGNLTLLNL